MTSQTLNVEGMTCGHCVETVTKAVQSLEGVEGVTVDLENKKVRVSFDENRVTVEKVSAEITRVGFEVVNS